MDDRTEKGRYHKDVRDTGRNGFSLLSLKTLTQWKNMWTYDIVLKIKQPSPTTLTDTSKRQLLEVSVQEILSREGTSQKNRWITLDWQKVSWNVLLVCIPAYTRPLIREVCHLDTELGVHDNWVVEGLADGYIAVLGHNVEEHHLYTGKVNDQEYVDRTCSPWNGPVTSERVGTGNRDSDSNIEHI